jgi:hypothetical protein
MKQELDITPLDDFFESDNWESICSQAIDEGNKNAAELMNILSVRIDSFYFFLELNDNNRAKRELAELKKLINVITESI